VAELRGKYDQIAVSIDVRNLPVQADELVSILDQIRQHQDLQFSSFFFDADNATLLKRYGESRRLHPLSKQQLTLEQAIHQETNLLAPPLSSNADLRIDTSHLSIHDLSEQIRERVLGKKEHELVMVFESFGFKHGIAKDADFVFDARFLPNPHWITELKPLTGLDEPVQRYLLSQPDVVKYTNQLISLLETWLPQLERNNRSYVTVAIGCTGGQHRSVFIAEQLANHFLVLGKNVQRRHRTLEKQHAPG
jgi:Predicted P-loop-containing kinase